MKIIKPLLQDNIITKPIKVIIKKVGMSDKVYTFLDKFELHNEISMKLIKSLIQKDNPLILEIGCNGGEDTIRFLNSFKNVTIYSFEPDPRAIISFKKRIGNDNRSILQDIAISNKNGETNFNLTTSTKDKDFSYSSTIMEPLNITKYHEHISYFKTIKVKTKKLDDWVFENNIGLIDFIWADVEGAERELILGGINTLNKKTKYFYTEFWDNELFKGQPKLKEIQEMLPNFDTIGIFDGNVLMKNKKLFT